MCLLGYYSEANFIGDRDTSAVATVRTAGMTKVTKTRMNLCMFTDKKYYYWKEPTARLIPESKSVRVLINLEIVLPDLESSSDLIRLWLIVISGVFQLLRKILPSWLITLFNQHLFVHMCSRDINVVDSEISKIDEETRIMIEELTDEVQQLFPYEKNITPSLLTRLYTTAKSNHAKQLIAIMNDIQNVELREYLLNVVRTS